MNWYKISQSINIAGEKMTPVLFNLINTIQYALYFGEKKAAITVKDMEVGEIVHLRVYPNRDSASKAYKETIEKDK